MRINSPEELKSMQEFYSQALNAQKKRILVLCRHGLCGGRLPADLCPSEGTDGGTGDSL